MSSLNDTTTNVVLDHPFTYFTWFAKIQGSVPKDLWKYFDPDQQVELQEPETTTVDQVRDGANSLHDLTAAEKTIFTQLRSIYTQDLAQYQRMLTQEALLRERIINSVTNSKRSLLQAGDSTREWLDHLAESTKPSDSQMQEMIRSKHRVKMSIKYSD